MEADNEWEDHLIVSYTPQQGSEMTMTEHQVERIIANTKLVTVQVSDKAKLGLHLDEFEKEPDLPPKVKQMLSAMLTCEKLKERHQYWNFVSRSLRRPNSLIAAVGNHVFHQTQTGEWQMFDEPGDSKYSGDIRFVLQWKQYDFVFVNMRFVLVYQEGKFVKNLEHKYSGNSSFGVKTSANYMYYFHENKMQSCDIDLKSKLCHPPTCEKYGDLLNYDVSSRDQFLMIHKKSLNIMSKGQVVHERTDLHFKGGACAYLPSNHVLAVGAEQSTAVLLDQDLKTIFQLALSDNCDAVLKLRLMKVESRPVFALLNPSSKVMVLAISRCKIYYLGTQDAVDYIYTFACLGDLVIVTGGFNRLFCHKVMISL